MTGISVKTQNDLLRSAQHLQLPFPVNMREMLIILALHDPLRGLNEFLSRFDWDSVTEAQIYKLFAGIPLPRPTVVEPDTSLRSAFVEMLLSSTFQTSALQTILTSFPEKRRDVFIHVPKCAGTDLTLNLGPTRLTAHGLMEATAWVSREECLAALADLARNAPFFDAFFVCGHISFSNYVARCGVRSQDRVFTILRDPIDMMLSQANYSISRLRQDPEAIAPDTRSIREHLGLTSMTNEMSPAELREAAVRALLDPRITQSNLMCRYLGSADEGSAAEALQNIVDYDVEVTDTKRYPRWLSERWGITEASRHNHSWQVLRRAEMLRLFGNELSDRAAEDIKFFNAVVGALDQSGQASIRGREVAKQACVRLLKEKFDHDPKPAMQAAAMVVVSGDAAAMDAQAAILPQRVTGYIPVVAVDASFGMEGNARPLQRDGWSTPERGFTWAIDGTSYLVLPRPEIVGDYLLQAKITPYIAKSSLVAQTLLVRVNSTAVGEARLSRPSQIECVVPWSVLNAADPVTIEFKFPDAARPSAISTTSRDQRCLGGAFATLRLISYVRPDRMPAEAIEVAPGSLTTLMLGFESLGENCEFGLVQRRCGAEPLGLLRFSSTPFGPLLKAMRAGFDGLGDPGWLDVQVSSNGREYMVHDRRYGFLYHAWVNVGDGDPVHILQRELRRLPLLVRKLREDLAEGSKIFVFHGMNPLCEAQAQELAAEIRLCGPGTLLWVELADETNPPGSVVQLAPGLLRGHMDRFAPGKNAHDLSLDSWITVCRNAIRSSVGGANAIQMR